MMTRKLGEAGPEVSAMGLGCMGMSELGGPARDAEIRATIHDARALEGQPPVGVIAGADVFETRAAVTDCGSHSPLLKT